MSLRTWTRAVSLTLSPIFILLLLGGCAFAQSTWTTVSGTSNISNTNSGTVAVASKGYSPSDGAGSSTLEIVGSGNGADSSILSLTHVWGARRYLFNIRATGVSNFTGALAFDVSTYNGSVVTTEAMRIDSSGNVGIGTVNPKAKLDIDSADGGPATSGTTQTKGGWLLNPTGDVTLSAGVNASNGYGWLQASDIRALGTNYSIVLNPNGGNVGIGTTNPLTRFVLNDGNATKNNVSMVLSHAGYGSADGASTEIVLGGLSDSGGQVTATGARIKSIEDYASGYGVGISLQYRTIGNSLTDGLTLTKTGNVGIGKTNPTVALDVVGGINLTGTINAKYQDVAEWVPSSNQFSAGTVVVLDSTKSNQVTSSSVSYDTRVAGVISEQPGIALGEKSEDKVLVATTGRVLVKVDATRAPIHVGDLLVTSDLLGAAMKSEPVNLGGIQLHRPGTLIGKALEPLEKGSGKILVLLSLQ
jgi:hypothetical protein